MSTVCCGKKYRLARASVLKKVYAEERDNKKLLKNL